MYRSSLAVAPLLLGIFVFLLGGTIWFHSYTGLKRSKAYFALVASGLAGGWRTFFRARALPEMYNSEHELDILLNLAAAGLVIVFLTAFVLRLWGRWIGDSATPAERQPGLPGIQAWFCMSNVVVGIGLILCAALGDDISPALSTVIVAGLLCAYPVLRMESPAAAPTPVAEDLSPEREKIVSMLEAGKLTPEEGADLLQALGGSARPPDRHVPMTGGQRLMLIGAALVTVGFFLPWFVIDPGREAARAMQQAQATLHSALGGQMELSLPLAGGGAIQTATVNVSGGEIPRGLGWAALALALAAAILPYVATTLDTATARTVRLLCLGVGALIVLYLLTQNLRFASFGLVIAVAGYVAEIAGALRQQRMADAA